MRPWSDRGLRYLSTSPTPIEKEHARAFILDYT